MSSHEQLLEAKALCAWYGAAQILYDVDLEVRRGEVVALMGRNGAGKSTTLKALIGMLGKRAARCASWAMTSRRASRTTRPSWAWASCPKTGACSPTSR